MPKRAKRAILTLSEEYGKKVERLAEAKGIAFATMCRSLIVERIDQIERLVLEKEVCYGKQEFNGEEKQRIINRFNGGEPMQKLG